jgi:hypothetical protein
LKPPGIGVSDDPPPAWPKGVCPEIVSKRDRFGEPRSWRTFAIVLAICDLGVREPGPIVIAGRGEEDLRLVLQPAKRLAVDDAIPIALVGWTDFVFRFVPQTSA